ncbi:MAG TPA: sigma-70 family RNA polymerase sigma factor [Polyangiales bacterium]
MNVVKNHAQLESAAQRRARDADALVSAARAGDTAAFDRLVRRFRPRIYALALHLSGSASDADDIAQDAFVQAYRHLPHFEGRSHFFTWLYRITVNRALSAQRAQRRGAVPLDDVRLQVALQVDAPSDPRLAVELRETYAALLEALDGLSSSLKSAVVLTALQGMSYQEAAIILGTSEGAIAVRIHTAREQLRRSLSAIFARRARDAQPRAALSRLNSELALALASVL